MAVFSKFVPISEFPLSGVKVEEKYLQNAFKKEVKYLLSLDADRLLAGFRDTAELDMKGKTRYPGWESLLIGGHTLGHYLTACVNCFEAANSSAEQKEKLLSVIEYILTVLDECQTAMGTGLIFGAEILDRNNPELQFDNVEKNKSELFHEAWVPWYTLHIIISGLVSAAATGDGNCEHEPAAASSGMSSCRPGECGAEHELTAVRLEKLRETAKKIVSWLADWVYRRVSTWNEETHAIVLGIEYGGMNDCLYDVYGLTGKKEHLLAAEAFDENALYQKVFQSEAGEDVLDNLHANTTIPKFMGALKHYTVTGERCYFDYAEKFWQLVTENHTYITGGNSEWEHFGRDGILNGERTNCNCETCNSYNMLKLTKLLFEITGDGKYADWYEGAFYNSILPSQNPETGMTTYFQPMASGYFKTFGEPETKFWCCVGSGMENFSKLGESLYFHRRNDLVVNQYISSVLSSDLFSITQRSRMADEGRSEFILNRDFNGRLLLRLPNWLSGRAEIYVNGEQYNYIICNPTAGEDAAGNGVSDDGATGNAAVDNGAAGRDENGQNIHAHYAAVTGFLASGTVISISLPMKVAAYNLADSENTYAFKYGPVLLSACLGTDDMVKTTTGVDVTIAERAVFAKRYLPGETEKITVNDGTAKEFIGNIEKNLVRMYGNDTEAGGAEAGSSEKNDFFTKMRFVLKDTDASITYVPHFTQYRERYGIYFEFCDSEKR